MVRAGKKRQKRTTEAKLIWLLEWVRNVRNNLFHGSNYPPPHRHF